MGKAERNRTRNARERIAAQQAAARRAERRRTAIIISGSAGVVIVIVVVLVIVALNRHPASQTSSSGSSGTALPASVTSAITSVPQASLTQVGTGPLPATSSLPIRSISDQALTSNGKPELLDIGAEFCPYCAAMRWSTAVALSKFGTFGPLRGIHSSSTDTDPNTATLTFYQQKYSSPYLTFTPIENETVTKAQLQPVTSAQQALWAKYEPGGQLGYPYIYFGGKVVITGPLYDPAVLKGLTWSQIATQMKNPKSTVAQNILGAANYQIASVCKMTGDTPASVCKTTTIQAIESKI